MAIEAVCEQIRRLDGRVEELCEKTYPETKFLREVPGVGAKVALSYILTLQSPGQYRFGRQLTKEILRRRKNESETTGLL